MQQSVSGWERPSFRNRLDEPLEGRTVPREVVRRFEPARAGLPEISARDACSYIEARHAERPWLAAARDCPPEVQRVFAALDRGSGHGHIRHEGWVTEQMNERRAAFQEDPAQLNLAKRAAGIDGLKHDQPHRCRQAATRITDADALASCPMTSCLMPSSTTTEATRPSCAGYGGICTGTSRSTGPDSRPALA